MDVDMAVINWKQARPSDKEVVRRLVNTANNIRAKRVGAPGRLFYPETYWLITQADACLICQKPLSLETVSLGYRQPLHKGGSNTIQNLILLCRGCNHKRALFSRRKREPSSYNPPAQMKVWRDLVYRVNELNVLPTGLRLVAEDLSAVEGLLARMKDHYAKQS